MPDAEIDALKAMIDGHGYVCLPDKPSQPVAACVREGRYSEDRRRASPGRHSTAFWIVGGREGDPTHRHAGRFPPGRGSQPSCRASMTLATPDLQTPLRAPPGVIDPAGVARREAALIEVLRARPGAALHAIADAAGHTRSATADRLRRLAARGAVVKVAGRWRLAGEEVDEPGEAAMPEPEPEDLSRWLRPISRYLRVVTSEFACTRYG